LPQRSVVEPWLCLGRGWSVYAGPVRQNRAHRHHLVQIAWSAAEPIAMMVGTGSPSPTVATGHAIDAGVVHRLDAASALRIVFLDPALPQARPWRRMAEGGAAVLSPPLVSQLEAGLGGWTSATGDLSAAETDERRAAVEGWLDARLEMPIRAAAAAEAVGLSEGRFLHWFAACHGLPFRAWLRWLRLQRALRCLAQGHSLTAAAHAAGFADSAHFSRTFSAAFGMAPRELLHVHIELSGAAGPL